jgi:hypothetical protein
VDQGDQFPGNPFHLIGVPSDQGYMLWTKEINFQEMIWVPAFHLIGVPVHSQG